MQNPHENGWWLGVHPSLRRPSCRTSHDFLAGFQAASRRWRSQKPGNSCPWRCSIPRLMWLYRAWIAPQNGVCCYSNFLRKSWTFGKSTWKGFQSNFSMQTFEILLILRWSICMRTKYPVIPKRYRTIDTSLVGGWATPLKNMKVNWDD